MPPPPNSRPRRDNSPPSSEGPSGTPKRRPTSSPRSGGNSRSSAGNPRASARPDESHTVDLTAPRRASSKPAPKSAPKPADPGAKRRAQKKVRARQNNLLAWTVALAVTVVIGGAAAGVYSELQTVKGRVAQKKSTLADLTAQLESGKRRLSTLSSASGKERVLVENGFIKPGERLLLFPKSAPPKN